MMEFDLPQIDRLLTTTRAVRKRLDLERPVEPDVIQECVRIAIQAPTGGGYAEQWRWLVVTDPGKRAQLADLTVRSYPFLFGSVRLRLLFCSNG